MKAHLQPPETPIAGDIWYNFGVMFKWNGITWESAGMAELYVPDEDFMWAPEPDSDYDRAIRVLDPEEEDFF